jgi:hypothetical protein
MRTLTTIGVMAVMFLAGGDRIRAQSLWAQSPPEAGPFELAQASRDKMRPGRKPADPKAEKKKPSSTLIIMELLTIGDGTGLKAREWMETIGKMDVTLTVRPGRPTEKVEVTEKKGAGTLRTVSVRGFLDNKGQLIFPDKTFTQGDVGKLAAWIEDLRTYGAQGNPEGRPAWGLSKEQFGVIHTALKRPIDFETRDLELDKVLEKLTLPADVPLRFSTAANRVLKDRGGAVVAQSLKGISQGTALAVILNDQGLAFHPRRLPEGTVELTAIAADESGGAWPVGWPRQQSPPETAPALFDIKAIDLEEEPLDGILEAAAGVIGIPILIDRPAMEARQIDLAKVKITHPRKRTTWITALNSFTFKAKAKFEVLIDEAGKPFLWVTPLATPARAQKE